VREPFLNSGLGAVASSTDLHDFFLRPDPAHGLFSKSLDSAEYVMTTLQEMGVRMTIVSRHAAYEGAVNRELYDNLAKMNTRALQGLRTAQRRSLEALFGKVSEPVGSAAREGLPDRCDVPWFAETMCAGVEPASKEEVWNHVSHFPLYDCVTILAGVPETAMQLFECGEESEYARHRFSPPLTHPVAHPVHTPI
jgi:hypothetical protein